jgi:hypothetical protein
MVEDVGVRATTFFQCVRKDSEPIGLQFAARQDAILVCCPGEANDSKRSVGGVEGDGMEGVKDATEEPGLSSFFNCRIVLSEGVRTARAITSRNWGRGIRYAGG